MNEIDLTGSRIAKLLAQHNRIDETLRRSTYREFAEALSRQGPVEPIQSTFDALTKSLEWPSMSTAFHSARLASQAANALAQTASLTQDHAVREAHRALAITNEFNHALKNAIQANNRAIRLHQDTIRADIERAAAELQRARDYSARITRHQKALASRLTKLTIPWVLKDYPALSVTGLVRLASLRDVVTEADPYTLPASDLYRHELGDPVPFNPDAAPEEREVTAIDSGTNPEVVAFPPAAYPSVLVVAGFEFDLPRLYAPTSDGGDNTGVFDAHHRELLEQVEHRLRSLVATELSRVAGTRWIRRRVPENTRIKWDRRKQEDQYRRSDSYALIYYADLMDLSDIICRRDNWNDVFSAIFMDRDDFQVGMRRLNPIRRAIAHGRPLVRTDQLVLCAEAIRLLRALGVMQ